MLTAIDITRRFTGRELKLEQQSDRGHLLSASEGAAHSHARRALSEGISEVELEHVAILSATTLGWPQAIRALTIVQDVTDAGKDTAD